MTIKPDDQRDVIVGVDTHADTHVAAMIDLLGRLLATASFPATRSGYARLIEWASTFGAITTIGIEGTGSWGRGLSLHCLSLGLAVRDVDRPDRRARRANGKTDLVDAEAAARAVLAGTATTLPKTGDGPVEMIRMIHITRESAVKARTQAINQIKSLVVTAPCDLAEQLAGLSRRQLITHASSFDIASDVSTPTDATRLAMRALARRIQTLTTEIDLLETQRDRLVTQTAPELLKVAGVGPFVAATLLIAAGDNPDRIHSEAAFAKLCAVAPKPASSGKTNRHRIDHGGHRQGNRALHTVVISRLRWPDESTRAYVAKHNPTGDGQADTDTIRRLKRYVAREVFPIVLRALSTPPEEPLPAA